mmetsp:Transcript_2556/g.5383  ORF Transcript_2556/g.5383 Transcript_2556/m.5383 type:complete len:81 (-) Transcript_2556:42-284(-)
MTPHIQGAGTVFEPSHPASVVPIPPESSQSANLGPLWHVFATLGITCGHALGRIVPVIVSMLLQKERLKLGGLTIDSIGR